MNIVMTGWDSNEIASGGKRRHSCLRFCNLLAPIQNHAPSTIHCANERTGLNFIHLRIPLSYSVLQRRKVVIFELLLILGLPLLFMALCTLRLSFMYKQTPNLYQSLLSNLYVLKFWKNWDATPRCTAMWAISSTMVPMLFSVLGLHFLLVCPLVP